MRNRILLAFFLPISVIFFAQSKEDLKKENETLKSEISKLKNEISSLKAAKSTQKTETKTVEKSTATENQDALSELNKLLLYPLFKDKYGKDGFFDRNGYKELNEVKSFANDIAVLNGIKADKKLSEDDRKLAEKSLTFLNLYDKYKVLVEKADKLFVKAYDEKLAAEIKKSAMEMDFSNYGKFNSEREMLLAKIENYRKETCAMNAKLTNFQQKVLPTLDGANRNQMLSALKNATQFQYIKDVVANISAATNLKEKLPCINAEAIPNAETVKENPNQTTSNNNEQK